MPVIYTDKPTPDRVPKDHYPTEFNAVRAIIAAYGQVNALRILDLGAGDDSRWGGIAKEHNPNCEHLAGVELRDIVKPGCVDSWYNLDFTLPLFHPPELREPGYDLIVSNPPYSHAEAFIRGAWELLRLGGRMMFLTQADFAAGGGRYKGLWVDLPPSLKVTLVRRVIFTGEPNDPNTHAVFVFDKGSDGQPIGSPQGWPERLLWYDRAWEVKGLTQAAYIERYGVDYV